MNRLNIWMAAYVVVGVFEIWALGAVVQGAWPPGFAILYYLQGFLSIFLVFEIYDLKEKVEKYQKQIEKQLETQRGH